MISLNHSMTGDPGDFTSSDDAVSMGVQASTHLDSLAHVGYDGLLYNGLSDTTTNETGATELGIEKVGAVMSRGILLDIARLHGVDFFDEAYAIGADDLAAWRESKVTTLVVGGAPETLRTMAELLYG
jgi:hypothetical protein